MSLKKPKLRPLLRVTAAGCVLVWLSASSYCSIEHLFARTPDSHQRGSTVGVTSANSCHGKGRQASREAGQAAKSQDRDRNGHDSKPDDDQGGACCSTLHPTAQAPQQPLQLSPFQTYAFPGAASGMSELVSEVPHNLFDRQSRCREWVFTPEVCLGPAFRSHAPPVSCLS